MADDVEQRLSIIKEVRGWSIEEAKLTGAYIKDAANPADVQAQVKQFVSEATKHGISEQDAYAKAYVLYPEAKQTVH